MPTIVGSPLQPAGTQHVAPSSSTRRARRPATGALPASSTAGPGSHVGRADGDELDLPRGVGVAVPLLVRAMEGGRQVGLSGTVSSNDWPR